jgi:hypothetical protein
VPFALKIILPQYGGLGFAFWLISTTAFSICITYIVAYVKSQMSQYFWVVPLFIGLLGLAGFLNYIGVFELTVLSEAIFTFAIQSPLVMCTVVGLLIFSYYINFKLVYSNTYLDELGKSKQKNSTISNFSFFDQYGNIGQLLNLELKLILRNKRSKSVVFTSLLFILYGLVFYTNDIYLEGNYMLIFAGVFITGMFMMNYGQFIPSWESAFFDGVLTRRIDSYQYFLSKYYLFVPISLLSFILSVPYAYFGWRIVAINFTALLFNLGVNAFIILFFSTYNDRRIDLSKRAVLNWEGIGASQFILIIPSLILPLVIFFPFDYFLSSPMIGYVAMGSIGCINLLFHKFWIKLIAKRFEQQKYKIASGFRKE